MYTLHFSQYDRYELLDKAFESNLSGTEFKVYYFLVREMDKDKYVRQSLEKIAIATKLGRRTVSSALEGLEKSGLIKREKDTKLGYTYFLGCEQLVSLISQKENISFSDVQFLPIQKLHIDTHSSETLETPFKGGFVESTADVQNLPVQKGNTSTEDVQNLPIQKGNIEFVDIFEKIEFLRSSGCNIGQVQLDGQDTILVDHEPMSSEEFLKRNISSFDRKQLYCPEGVALVKNSLAKIQAKIPKKYI